MVDLMTGDQSQTRIGDVIDRSGRIVQPAPPMQVPPQGREPHLGPSLQARPRLRPKRRIWPVLVVVALVLCCLGTPVAGVAAWFGLPLLRGTVEAGKGSATPSEAAYRLFLTFEQQDGDFLAPRYIVRSQKDKVMKVRAAFMAERRADQKAHPTDAFGELKIAGPQPGDPPQDFGDSLAERTTVLFYYQWMYSIVDDGGAVLFMNGGGLPWKAEVVKERDGWRVWSLAIPPWCGIEGQPKSGYARCSR
jgi:hypothetical protein